MAASLRVLGHDGSFPGQALAMGWKEGLLKYPSQLCIDAKVEVFIADTNNKRGQIFQLLEYKRTLCAHAEQRCFSW
jgi:hypothetical protein